MTTVEDIERQQRRRRILFRVSMLLLLALLCIFIGWVISQLGYKDLQSMTVFPPVPSLCAIHADFFLSGAGAV